MAALAARSPRHTVNFRLNIRRAKRLPDILRIAPNLPRGAARLRWGMGLQPCAECGGVISTVAVMCPHCGAPPSVALRAVSHAAGSAVFDEPLEQAVRAALRLPEGELGHEQLARVESLKLDENFSGDLHSLVEALLRLPSLKMLGISRGGLTDVSPLARLQSLRYLYLEGNRIHDVGPLCEMKALRQLWLYGNPLSREDIAMVEQALPRCEVFF